MDYTLITHGVSVYFTANVPGILFGGGIGWFAGPGRDGRHPHHGGIPARFAGLPKNDAGMLIRLVGRLKVSQVVDPQKTARFEFPKWELKE